MYPCTLLTLTSAFIPATYTPAHTHTHIHSHLRSTHTFTHSQEIGSKFVPKPEERLLAVVNALLHRCYKVPFSNQAEVPQLLRKELAGVCKACFSPEQAAAASRAQQQQQQQAKGGAAAANAAANAAAANAAAAAAAGNTVQRDLREAFVRDMTPDGPNFPKTLGELSEQLKHWRAKLQVRAPQREPRRLAGRQLPSLEPLVWHCFSTAEAKQALPCQSPS